MCALTLIFSTLLGIVGAGLTCLNAEHIGNLPKKDEACLPEIKTGFVVYFVVGLLLSGIAIGCHLRQHRNQ